MRVCACVLLAATVGLTGAIVAQQPADPVPQFRSSARLVQVSVVVRDRRNRPVEGLDRGAFQIFEDGQEQPVSLFLPAARTVAAARTAPVVPTGSGPRFTNRIVSPRDGGVVAIIFDQLNTLPNQQTRARDHLLKFLKSLRSEDRVALYVLGANRLQVLYDFTTDAEMLVRALESVAVGSMRTLGPTSQQIPPALLEGLSAFAMGNQDAMNAAAGRLRAEMTLENLKYVAKHLAGVPGRKNIIWLSAGFPFIIGPGNNMSSETRQAMRLLNDVDAVLYPVDVRGLMVGQGAAVPTLSDVYGPIEGLRASAEWTGGRAFFNTNDLSDAMARAVDESRSTYVLGYYPANADWNGKFRSIKVKVARDGVEIRHRPGYLAHPEVAPALDADRQRDLLAALAAPLEATGLPFDVDADVTADRVVLRLHVDASQLVLNEAAGQLGGNLDVAITQLLEDGRVSPEMSASYPFNVPAAARERLLATPIQLTRTMQVAPNARQVRIAIRDARSATIGSIFIAAERLRPPREPRKVR